MFVVGPCNPTALEMPASATSHLVKFPQKRVTRIISHFIFPAPLRHLPTHLGAWILSFDLVPWTLVI